MVYHGTITRRLGIDLAIRALDRLKDEIQNLEFWVLGRGDDLNTFAALSRRLGLEDRIHFNRDMVPLEDLGALLCDMDLGVIANRKDAATELMLPVKMLEYMALGIPVVAPELKTIRYYFDGTQVCYYSPEDVESMAQAIRHIYDDDRRKSSQIEAASRFFETYGWDRHKHELIANVSGIS